MVKCKLINNMMEFLEYTQIVSLLKDQMAYIKTPKSSTEIKETIKLMFDTEHAKLMVIEDNGLLLGFVFFNVSIGLQTGGKYIWLNEMHIHHKYRGMAYGSILFNELKKWAKNEGIRRIMGIVDTVDERTRDFYIKQGTEVYKEDIFSVKL